MQGMRELGYVEGKNIFLEFRHGEGKPEGFRSGLKNWSVSNWIYRGLPRQCDSRSKGDQTIPTVIYAVSDPVGDRTCCQPRAAGRKCDRNQPFFRNSVGNGWNC